MLEVYHGLNIYFSMELVHLTSEKVDKLMQVLKPYKITTPPSIAKIPEDDEFLKLVKDLYMYSISTPNFHEKDIPEAYRKGLKEVLVKELGDITFYAYETPWWGIEVS